MQDPGRLPSVGVPPGSGSRFPSLASVIRVLQGTLPWTVNVVQWVSTVIAQDNVAQFGGTAVSLGQKVAASSIPVVLDSDLDRGQKAMAASVPVVVASDQAALPVNFGTGGTAFTNISRAVGTYTFTLPAGNVGKGLIVRSFNNAGTTGTATPSIAENDNLGPGVFTLLTGLALAVGASSRLRVYPGLVAAANVAGNDLVGQGSAPIIQLVVATAATTCVVTYSSTQ